MVSPPSLSSICRPLSLSGAMTTWHTPKLCRASSGESAWSTFSKGWLVSSSIMLALPDPPDPSKIMHEQCSLLLFGLGICCRNARVQQSLLDFALRLLHSSAYVTYMNYLALVLFLKNDFNVLPSLLWTLIFNARRLVMSKLLPNAREKLVCSWMKQKLKLFHNICFHSFHDFVPLTSSRTLEILVLQRNFCCYHAWNSH